MNKQYTLDNFIVKSSNEDAFFGALSIMQKPMSYSPLCLYGGAGAGKTHLLKAITNEFGRIYRKPVVYVNARQFLDDFISSLKYKSREQFNQKYRENSLLVIDDFHLVAGRCRSEEELIITFKAMELKGRQVVLSSDRHLNDINDLDWDLRSHCLGGLALGISI